MPLRLSIIIKVISLWWEGKYILYMFLYCFWYVLLLYYINISLIKFVCFYLFIFNNKIEKIIIIVNSASKLILFFYYVSSSISSSSFFFFSYLRQRKTFSNRYVGARASREKIKSSHCRWMTIQETMSWTFLRICLSITKKKTIKCISWSYQLHNLPFYPIPLLT